ncbi:SDR family NAD(P)-dependent oxidoreductase [Dactylosporangium sp. NPDC005572]|uniref:SDR family NAD(P)-dependent oxidoreductase n=1 Tax=Dactylosporangium sp. NPDC005572 TaxID=3156889 RepID=UPI0033AB331F
MRLEPGMVAVVTGAASGIGRALATGLAARGLDLALTDVEAAALDGTVAGLPGTASVLAAAFDVADPAAVDGFAAAVEARFGRADLVCNIAGVVGPRVPTWQQRPADWQWILQVNLIGPANVLRAFLPMLLARGSAHVVNVASIAGLAPIAGGGNAPYAASKFAVVGLSETLRVELDAVAPTVGVTVVCPGPVATRIREAERNRPVALGGGTPVTPPTFTNAAPSISADDAAAQIVAAVEADRPYLLTNPENAAEVRARHARVERCLP